MTKHNYDQRFFRTVSNAPGGETGAETVFHYRQEGEVVWATYKGGEVVFRTLLAKVDGLRPWACRRIKG